MSDLSALFSRLRQKGEAALIPFVTAGDPHLDQLPAILATLAAGGADAIEVGIPFSDPIADGPTIQAASQRALDRGVTPGAVLEKLHQGPHPGVPIILMGYYNPILRRGLDAFATAAREAGASATIVSDLNPEESGEWRQASERAGLDTIFLVAPTSTPERVGYVAEHSSGFLYAVSRTGVTGAGSQVPAQVRELVASVRDKSEIPVCVGFGISRPEHVQMVSEFADGAIIGSSLVEFLAESWDNGQGAARLEQKIAELKAATRRAN